MGATAHRREKYIKNHDGMVLAADLSKPSSVSIFTSLIELFSGDAHDVLNISQL